MLLIKCPWCGLREQTEFSYHGEAHITRPLKPADTNDREWADFLFFRKNPKGTHYERWMHAFGCRRYFNMARDTVSGEIYGSYAFGEAAPVPGETTPVPGGKTPVPGGKTPVPGDKTPAVTENTPVDK